MVDYEINGGNVTNFKMFVADWGSAFVQQYAVTEFFGGTPVYAGPRTFYYGYKDVFSFGRLAMELFMNKSGTDSKL